MKVLIVHNKYRQFGGEDTEVQSESRILEANGHIIKLYERSNEEITDAGLGRVQIAWETIWSRRSYESLRQHLREFRPDVVHCHNTFPLVSPSVYFACQREGVPVVQTLQNYRLLCPAATFYRQGHICEECVQHSLMRSVVHSCYHQSPIHSGIVATMLKIHRLLGTWKHKVNAYIALTEFGRRKFIENGLPANKVFVKGNLSLAPQLNRFDPQNRHGALFVGRLESEKGILTLLSAWRDVKNLPLRIVGTGSLHSAVKRMIETHNLENVELVGEVDRSEVWRYYQEASVLIVPSEWYEGFPLVIVEAYSTGIPVIASRIGGLQEIVRDGETGLLFNPGDHEALSARVRWVVDHPLEVKTMGERAREVHDREYSAEANYQQLLAIYISVMASR